MTAMDDFWREILDTVNNLDSRSYYDLLGVDTDATAQDIGIAYYTLVRTHHPDRHTNPPDPEHKQALVRLFARMGEAYRVLCSPKKRRAYDQLLSLGQTRLLGEPLPQKPQLQANDPRSPQARSLFEHGQTLLEQGDARAARARWELALQFEPESRTIREAIDSIAASIPQSEPQKPAASPPRESYDSIKSLESLDAFDALDALDSFDSISTPELPVPPGAQPAQSAHESAQSAHESAQSAHQAASSPTPTTPATPAPEPAAPQTSMNPVSEKHTLPAPPVPAPPVLAQEPLPVPLGKVSAPGRRPVAIRCANWEQVAQLYQRKICGRGLFLRTQQQLQKGAAVPVLVRLPDKRSLALDGQVAKVAAGAKKGVLVRFAELKPEITEAFEEAVVRVSEPEEGPADIGRRALAEGRFAEAVDSLGEALEADPDDASLRAAYYLALAYDAKEHERMREAQFHFQTAIHFDPDCNKNME